MKLKNLVRKLIIPAAGICVTAPVMLGAAEVTFAQTNGHSASEAVAWVRSLEGQGVDYDGAYGNQCVDLIKAYYNYLGETPVRGNANTYSYNSLPDGWQRIQDAEPQPGDILVYTGGSYGHVAIYTGENESYHQNWGGSYVQKVTGDYRFSGMSYWGVIRPDFEDSGSDDTSSSDSVNVTSDEDTSYSSEDNYSFEAYENRPWDEGRSPFAYNDGFRPGNPPDDRHPWENRS